MENRDMIKRWNEVYYEFDYFSRNSVWREEPTKYFTDKIPFLKSLGIESIVDAGGGDGRNIKLFLEEGFNVINVDYSDVALKKCLELYGNYDNLILKNSSLENIDIKSNSIDVVITEGVLVHQKNLPKVISEINRILKPNGYGFLSFDSIKDPFYGIGEKVGENTFVSKEVLYHFHDVSSIKKLLKEFNIHMIDSIEISDPGHGPGYSKPNRHKHVFEFAFVTKPLL